MRFRYSAIVGVFFVVVVAIALLSDPGEDGGALGVDFGPKRWALPEFAVPLATAQLEGDANLAQDDCESSALPCPQEARREPACGVRAPGSVRVCDLFGRPSVISFWFTKGGDECVRQQDVLDRVSERYRGRVNFLSLDVRDDRDTVRELVRERGWSVPVGYDRDGAVASLYRVGGCPTFTFAYPGGLLWRASAGVLSEEGLEAEVEGLLGATRRAERL